MCIRDRLITFISELAKRNGFIAALAASLPITSLITILWIYFESGDVQKIANFSISVFWLVIPSLIFFICLTFTLRHGIFFPFALFFSSGVTALCYLGYCKVIGKFGIQL